MFYSTHVILLTFSWYTNLSLRSYLTTSSILRTGWPDWANFRPLGGCLLWLVFFVNDRSSPHFGLLVPHSTSIVLILSKNEFGYIWAILHKLIWSPCLRTSFHSRSFWHNIETFWVQHDVKLMPFLLYVNLMFLCNSFSIALAIQVFCNLFVRGNKSSLANCHHFSQVALSPSMIFSESGRRPDPFIITS
jgi:hypothetical protein